MAAKKKIEEHQTEYTTRSAKRVRILASGEAAYPAKSNRAETLHECLDHFDEWAAKKKSVVVAGRVRSVREHGGLTFTGMEDASGSLQIVFKKDHIGEASYARFLNDIDVGDFIEISGKLFLTKRGEKSVDAQTWVLLTKALRPLPEKWHGLTDIEERLRRRYVDLIANPEEREMFVKKSVFWNSMRQFLQKRGFVEVETPVLERIPGGADAEPFVTHMNALDIELFLRISLELPLKRLIVGGFEKVFEIGRIFRNEGVDREHLQDYTQMECYWAYADYGGMMKLIQEMYRTVIHETTGSLLHEWNGTRIDWSKPWATVEYCDVFQKKTEINLKTATEKELIARAKKEKLDPGGHPGKGRLIDLLFKKLVRPRIVDPTFLINLPIEISPLSKRLTDDPTLAERFQIMVAGTEIGNGFSELNDPVDQRQRFEEQMKLRKEGDKEAQRMDEDYVEALEYGMPPTAGFGISERLFSVIMNRPIRETVFFRSCGRKGKE